jgi:glutamine amidotransferase
MIAVLDYGIGNLRSAEKALLHLGAEVRLVTRPAEAAGASGVVLPGVGAFGSSVRALRATGLDAVALKAIETGVPFLGICVGYQVLFEGSEESPGEPGLSVLDGSVCRLGGDIRLPQMQWNIVRRTATPSKMLAGAGAGVDEWMYFVHSYVPVPSTKAARHVVGTTNYGSEIAVAIEADNLWGVQFHPEKSSRAGLAMLGRFIEHVSSAKRQLS